MEWIRVEDRLPDKKDKLFTHYLVCRNNGIKFVCSCYYLKGKFYNNSLGDNEFMNPTHWMPLPDPPTTA